MKTIAIANQKGGVGKTTTSVNLAAALAAAGRKVLLADLDSQGNATSAMGLDEVDGRSLYRAIIGEVPVDELVQPTRLKNLHAIAADLEMAGAEIEVAQMPDHLLQLRRTLAALKEQDRFEFALLDCPPSLGVLMTNALCAADEILVPIQCEYYALEGLSKLMLVIDQLRSAANPDLYISGMVLTMFDQRTNLNSAVVKDVRAHFEEVVFETVIPRSIRFGEAPSFGRTIFEHDPGGAGSIAYSALAKEFLRRQAAGIRFVNPSPVEIE